MRLVANCHRKTLSLIGFFPITLIFLFAQISSVYAGSFTVYGPEAFERTAGSKNSFTVDFQVPITRDDYQIHIQSDSVTSAIVRINGNDIFTPSSFSNKVSELNKTVSLQTNNQLYVELRGKPGSLLTISIVGIDNTSPTITAYVSPIPNNDGWHNEDVTVSFDCQDDFSGIAVCTQPGLTTQESSNIKIAGEAIDIAGNKSTTYIVIHIDKTAPLIKVSIPTITNQPNFSLVGTAVDANTIKAVVVNGIQVHHDQDNAFGTDIQLNEGKNQLAITATDIADNSKNILLDITLDTVAPNIPNSNLIGISAIEDNKIEIRGEAQSVEPDATVSITNVTTTVTYSATSQNDGSFSSLITANPGDFLSIIAMDTASNQSESLSIQVPNESALSIEILSPDLYSTINTPLITVSGTFSAPEGSGVSVNGRAALIINDTFIINHVSLTPGANTITATVTAPNNQSSNSQIEVNLDNVDQPKVFVVAKHDSGYVPFETEFYIIARPGIRPSRVQVDYDDDGQFDSFENYNKHSPITHTFYNGVHTIKFRIIDVDNNTYDTSHIVISLDVTEVDSLLRQSFQSMKESLIAGDIENALYYFTDYRRQEFRSLFLSMGNNLSSIAANSGDLNLEKISGQFAQYVLIKTVEGKTIGSPVIFTKNHDGIWRIDDM